MEDNEIELKNFMFYGNFWAAIEQLPKEQAQEACYEFCKFGVTGELPENPMLKMFCLGVSASVQKYQGRGGARKGAGRPPLIQNIQKNQKNQNIQNEQTKTKTKTKTETKTETKTFEKNKENVQKKTDIYCNKYKTFFVKVYKDVFKQTPFLSLDDCKKIVELSTTYPPDIIETAIKKLKKISFDDIEFKPSASWLLKDNNFERVMNGEFDKREVKEIEFKY